MPQLALALKHIRDDLGCTLSQRGHIHVIGLVERVDDRNGVAEYGQKAADTFEDHPRPGMGRQDAVLQPDMHPAIR